MKPVEKSNNTRLIIVSYVLSILTYLIGLYFLAQGYLAAFLGIFPTLFFGIYLIYKNERRYGLLLVIFFFVWILIYYYYLPNKIFNR
jgi:hypothetical protein